MRSSGRGSSRPNIWLSSRTSASADPRRRRSVKLLQIREVMRERGDLFFAQGVGDVGHGGAGTADALTRFVVVQRLHEIFLALSGEPRDCLGPGIGIGVA